MSDHTISLAFSVERPRPDRKGLRRTGYRDFGIIR